MNLTLSKHPFTYSVDQPDGASDFTLYAGVFQVRVRVPAERSAVPPAMWVGFTAGGPLVERPSHVRYTQKDLVKLVDDAVLIARILRGY
jgi:hypothetical protein